MAAATLLTPDAADRGGEIVCGCFDLTRAELERAAAGLTFVQFLEETKAGSRCSACLLDVEYLFVNAPKKAGAARGTAKREARPPLKQRLYAVLDRISPLVPFRLVNAMPLLSGTGIVQRLWLVNQPLVFGEAVDAVGDLGLNAAVDQADDAARNQLADILAREAAPARPFGLADQHSWLMIERSREASVSTNCLKRRPIG